MSGTRVKRTRDMRYKRPALASMGFDVMRMELWDIREACTDIQQYDYLKASFDILRDENTSLLQTIKEIDAAYNAVTVDWWHCLQEASRRFDALLENLPDRVWVE